MFRTTLRAALLAATLSLVGSSSLGISSAQAQSSSQLFYNYYVGPPGVPAQLYVSPRPTPPMVGHTWVTYPPFMPHEYLYHHRRTYRRCTPDGVTVARVKYF